MLNCFKSLEVNFKWLDKISHIITKFEW